MPSHFSQGGQSQAIELGPPGPIEIHFLDPPAAAQLSKKVI